MTGRTWTLAAELALVLVACSKRPPPDLLQMPDASHRRALAADGGAVAWDARLCQPLPGPPASDPASDFTVSGECNLHFAEKALCRGRGDDFYATIRRDLADGSRLIVYINVENFHGPDSYQESQEYVSIGEGTTLYRWANARAGIKLEASGPYPADGRATSQFPTAGVTLAVFPTTLLEAEVGTPTRGQIRLTGTLQCNVGAGSSQLQPMMP